LGEVGSLLFHFSGFPPGIDVRRTTALIQQQIAEALGALNGATRRLRKTKSGFLSTTFLVSPLLYLFGLPNLPAKVSN
jgi:hypothetical protein